MLAKSCSGSTSEHLRLTTRMTSGLVCPMQTVPIPLFPSMTNTLSDAIVELHPSRDLIAASIINASGSGGSEIIPGVNEWIEKVASGQIRIAGSIKVRLHRRLDYGHV